MRATKWEQGWSGGELAEEGLRCRSTRMANNQCADNQPDAGVAGTNWIDLSWSQDWLWQVYGQCPLHITCRNEFGFAWRYLVPETKRPGKSLGVCLCKRYADQAR